MVNNGDKFDAEIALREDYQGARILLIEDNAFNLEMALKLLTNVGLKVTCAENGYEALTAVEKNYYDLQYLIYSLALHRYLKQTLVDYDVNQHFGGVYYLYLRGMTTAPEHQGAGVYYRKITEQEINKLDALFSNEKCNEEA